MSELTSAQKAAFKPVAVSTTVAKSRVELTPAAVNAVREQLEKRGSGSGSDQRGALRIGIKGGGCSGYSYAIEFDDDEPRERDLVFEFPEEGKSTVRVFCDKKSILYLGGSVLDWEKTLMFQGFKFTNPHEASACGCGHSFTVT